MLAFFLLVYKFETFRSVSIHHLAALVQKELQNSNKKNWDTLMINVDFFGVELEALFLNLVNFYGGLSGQTIPCQAQTINAKTPEYIGGAAVWNHFHFPRLLL